MATWKKIVTESSDNTIAQDTTGNAATATQLAENITINLTTEVTGSLTNDLTSGETFNIVTTVADEVLDVANFNPNSVVTGTEVANSGAAFLNTANGGNSTLATTAAVVEYIDDQGFGAGSGDIGQVRVIAGNGLNITAVGGDTSESPADTATAASGNFEATLALNPRS